MRRVVGRNIGRVLVLVVALFILATLPGCSHEKKPVLIGHVTSTEEGPMEGVLVSAKNENTPITVTVVTDASGAYRAFPTHQVKFTVDDPLQAHVEQLGKYTDDDMHNVLAYLQTLR